MFFAWPLVRNYVDEDETMTAVVMPQPAMTWSSGDAGVRGARLRCLVGDDDVVDFPPPLVDCVVIMKADLDVRRPGRLRRDVHRSVGRAGVGRPRRIRRVLVSNDVDPRASREARHDVDVALFGLTAAPPTEELVVVQERKIHNIE